jgi:hypothetical protein
MGLWRLINRLLSPLLNFGFKLFGGLGGLFPKVPIKADPFFELFDIKRLLSLRLMGPWGLGGSFPKSPYKGRSFFLGSEK